MFKLYFYALSTLAKHYRFILCYKFTYIRTSEEKKKKIFPAFTETMPSANFEPDSVLILICAKIKKTFHVTGPLIV